jgi:ABC-2 type transport system permease protein
MADALWTELLKARRSRLPLVSALAFVVAAGVGGMFMFILQNPARARQWGLLGAKAQLTTGTADWPGYLLLLAQTIAVGGFLIFGIITIWLFGREFAEHTAKDLMALPTTRTTIVAAKFTVAAVWSLLLCAETAVFGLLIGTGLRLPGWSTGVVLSGMARLLVTGAMAVLLGTALGLAASVGRGYLSAIGCLFAIVFTAQVVAVLGYGAYFPWSVPALYSGAAGPDQIALGPLSYGMVVAVGVSSVVGAALWWQRADQPGG